MRLRNKKTGGVDDFKIEATGLEWLGYTSLKEFCEVWEDYEEPEEYWYIEPNGVIARIDEWDCCTETDRGIMKQIGNYFGTEEEAEKAVEKLKAWKRLRDKGFKFNRRYKPNYGENFVVECRLPKETLVIDVAEDLDLLFGGEE